MKKYYFLFCLVLTIPIIVKSQEELIRKYRTQQYMHELSSGLKSTKDAVKQNQRDIVKKQKNSTEENNMLYILPLVFHIIYDSKQIHPTKDQVNAQLNALNSAFDINSYKVKHKADKLEGFDKKVANTGISFCLTDQTPQGKNTDGIIEVNTPILKWGFNNDMKSAAKGGQNAWDTKRYVNIWVVNMADSVSGFAQLPGGPENSDGIVIDFRFFGVNGLSNKPYNEGKTLVHLMANYLNLHDLWNEYQTCGDDYVNDTPIHNAPNTQNFPYKHISTCGTYPVEMLSNFMDNTPDSIQTFFTQGQKERMQFCLQPGGPRELLTQTNLKCKSKENNTLEIRQIAKEPVIKIYPNPSYDEFNVSIISDLSLSSICLINNNQGKLIESREFKMESGQTNLKFDSINWPPGMYYVRIVNSKSSWIRKIIIQN